MLIKEEKELQEKERLNTGNEVLIFWSRSFGAKAAGDLAPTWDRKKGKQGSCEKRSGISLV